MHDIITTSTRHYQPQSPRNTVLKWYSQLSISSLNDIDLYYAENARFRDPHNNVSGLKAIKQIFIYMFSSLENPFFTFHDELNDGHKCFVTWTLKFSKYGKDFSIHGGTLLEFSEDGKVTHHRDYWDSSEELYEKLPIIGTIFRWLRKSLSAPQKSI